MLVGCTTGFMYEGGHDHTFYRYRQHPRNYHYARSILHRFVTTPVIMNLCEDLYDPQALVAAHPHVYLVHSKGA